MIKKIVTATYKTIRSILFTVTLLIVGLYVLVYALISIPAFTNYVKNLATSELSGFLGGTVEIENLYVYPFNEIRIEGLTVSNPQGERCIEVETIGAGIRLWKLLTEQKIELTYGEIIGLNANIEQSEKGAPLNIDFIIKAFEPKQKNEKKAFSLALKNVVLRKSSVSFRRDWLSDRHLGELDLSNLEIRDLAADITFPLISDQGIEVDLRRLSMNIPNVTQVEKIGFTGEFSPDKIIVKNLTITLPSSQISIPAINLIAEEPGQFIESLTENLHTLEITDSYLSPSDFSFLYPPLKDLNDKLPLELKADGNLNKISIEEFSLGSPTTMSVSFAGEADGLKDFQSLKGDISNFHFYISNHYIEKILLSIPALTEKYKESLTKINELEINGDFIATMADHSIKGNVEAISNVFIIAFEGGFQQKKPDIMMAEGELNLQNLHLHEFFPNLPFGIVNANLIAETVVTNKMPEGMVSLVVEDVEFREKKYAGFSLNLSKIKENIEGDFLMHNDIADVESKFSGLLTDENQSGRLDIDVQRLNLSEVTDMKAYTNYLLSGTLNIDGDAQGLNYFEGTLIANNFNFFSPDKSKHLTLKQLKLTADVADSIHSLEIKSDWLDFRAEGPYRLKELPVQLQNMVSNVFPALIPRKNVPEDFITSDMDFDLVVKKNNSLADFFHLPVRLIVPLTIYGSIQGSTNSATLSLDLPYLQQGRDKLIYDTKLVAELDGQSGSLNTLLQTNVPVKRGDLSLNISLFGHDNALSTDVRWVNTENSDFKAHLMLDTEFAKNHFTSQPEIKLHIRPSVLQMGTADWNLSNCNIDYADNTIKIDGLKVWHEDQFVEIKGIASPEYSDVMQVSLADIDVDYIFEMLAINYVTFGGVATGEIAGHGLLGENPVAETESLLIKKFSYNGADLGECKAASKWNNDQKEIEIFADIFKEGRQIVKAGGGIWLGKDSLSFNIGAEKVPVDFVQPFMAVFSSHVGGFATGDVTLYGTFRDIDMTGKIFADSVAVKLDYTNTIYHGSDSVLLYPGKIEIPHFELYDKFGNSALLTGELTHRFFHDPAFTFRLTDADNFLCYDTNSDLNPDWYGTLFGTGSALLEGEPGITNISADMTVSGNSAFTFVLSDTQYAQDYQFLTFTDRRAEANKISQTPTVQDIKEMLRQRMHQEEGGLSKFGIYIRATVTPQVLFTLIMDPRAGDKITARGRGAMQVKYESDDDEMMMYGKYEIDEGNYNFSLQDIILRDFKIKEGSYISFNGNPLSADLDISATYRVNTNLSDLDKSFSTDRDLNRTNVPVDAVLSVTGNMTSPDITFDIELPTLTQDVERKVKSIISTEDMMNRQIIYLLALNRFYTPEYMGSSSNGGELAAVASTTISSQLSNILGQLTDKFSVSPSFRSDKGDFSDIEVDVALSSRLLNNRLLINGNFGYRDRSNSSTTFVGDFDVEYLLSKNGNLRLKAYNHFNDQNYYLREALTTQGLGVVYRRDFDDWFTFLKKRKK